MTFLLLPVLGLLLVTSAAFAKDRDDDRRRQEPRVILYEHAEFQGRSVEFRPGVEVANLSEQPIRFNDTISSVRVEGGAEVYLYDDPRFRGQVLRLTESARNLTGRFLPGSTTVSWNDRISSLKVEVSRRGSGNARGEAEDMIKKVFQDLLRREPQENDLNYFRGNLLDKDWTEGDVRDELRRTQPRN